MNLFKNAVLIGAAAFALTACAIADKSPETKLEQAKKAPQSTPFYNALSKNYLDFAIFEVGQNDRSATADFANRSIIAGSGAVILPEEISKRKLPSGAVGELTDARNRLIAALDAGGRANHPKEAALAQAKFDCWMEQQEENFQPDHINACKLEWQDAMSKLTKVLAAPEPAKEAKKVTKLFIIYFDFNKDDITAAASAIIDQAVAAKNELKPDRILLSGHTDTSGSNDYNKALSMKRINAAIKAFADRKVAAAAFNSKSLGEEQLRVPTGDNVKEAGNRRVEIYFEK